MDATNDRPRRAAIRIGLAGWDYPDWNGVVYPAGGQRSIDRLAWVSRFVDVIEINSTFYRPAAPRSAAAWVRRTQEREGFTFTAKAHRSWTHEVAADLTQAVAETRAGLQPLWDAGRLGALLIQFPQSFHFGSAARERIERLLDPLGDWPVCVEVRHVSWGADAAARWFAERGVGWCLVDQPIAGRATLEPLPRVTAPVAYARLHGRNVANWFRPDAGRDARYDYLYSEAQLREVADKVEQMAGEAEQVFVIQNNHFRGQALVNALQLKQLVHGKPPLAPEELVEAYPHLGERVTVRRRRLF